MAIANSCSQVRGFATLGLAATTDSLLHTYSGTLCVCVLVPAAIAFPIDYCAISLPIPSAYPLVYWLAIR
jgi:hypothetical protein